MVQLGRGSLNNLLYTEAVMNKRRFIAYKCADLRV
jgi:hypothetical protein